MHETIVYFEDDRELSKVVTEFLEGDGYKVQHYTTMPKGGLEEIEHTVEMPPFLVLMDVRLDGDNGFDICHLFKHSAFFADVPVVFMSGLVGEDDILLAYEAGAYDYLPKPVTLKTLSAKCKLIGRFKSQTAELKSQVSTSELVAFDAMNTSFELGNILRFHEKIASLSSLDVLAEQLVQQVTSFNVSASVMFNVKGSSGIYYSDDGNVYELEKQIFNMLKAQGRVYSWSNRTLFNYDDFSVLVRSMPVDDELRLGNLKDQVCLLLNGVESRVRGIVNENELKVSEDNIRMVAKTLGKLVLDIQNNNLSMSEQFEKIISELEVDVNEELTKLNLLQAEEDILTRLIATATNDAGGIFEQSKTNQQACTKIMIQLLEKLSKK